jgi:hypothetical protein
LFNACKKFSTPVNDFPVVHTISDYDSIYSDKNDILGTISNMEIIDSIIIAKTPKDDHYFAFIDVNSGKLLTKWGVRGQGPGEYPQISTRFTVFENNLVFLDNGKQEINYVPVSAILKQDSVVAKTVKQSYPYITDFRSKYVAFVGDTKIVGGAFKKGHFGILDSSNNIVSHPFDFPFIYKGIDGIYRGSTFQSIIKSNTKQRKFAISFLYSDIFEIYQVNDTNIVKIYASPFKHIPQITVKPKEYTVSAVDYYNSIAGLTCMAVSDDFVCFAWSSKNYEESANLDQESNEILCFDWNGEKVKKYILPFPVHRFCIDKKYIYGLRYYNDNETVIYRFNLE